MSLIPHRLWPPQEFIRKDKEREEKEKAEAKAQEEKAILLLFFVTP
jgi:hypothetical protein